MPAMGNQINAAVDNWSAGRTTWMADAYRDGKRFIIHADEKLTAFVELGPRFTQVQGDLLSIDVKPNTTHHSGVG